MSHGGDIYRNKVDIDFSVNLNPLGIRNEMKEALIKALDRSEEYPDQDQRLVREKIADMEGLDFGNVFAGCGASELIPAIVRSLRPENALIFAPSYTGYERALDGAGVDILYHNTMKESGFDLTMEDVNSITDKTDLVFLCDPINPTGKNIKDDVFDEMIRKSHEAGARVILDESFYLLSERCRGSFRTRSVGLLRKYDNLYILRSFTKLFCVPGIRAGIVLGSHSGIREIAKQVPEWNLPVTSEAVISTGYDIMKSGKFIKETLEAVRSGREYLTKELKVYGFGVYDSDTSFVLFEGPEGLKTKLLSKGILIRECDDYPSLGKGYYRIAVRKEEDNTKLIKAIGECLV
ncbi:MAG: aminotransferase class I/II-fold pyridoxal phosphate-dependent enzyme [Lachnospiraceae bacterium]|nr:aminotransferase class I/II-fold pyridoxal phosphate-dependent enzyme [Lachnospiraceae bacterium]